MSPAVEEVLPGDRVNFERLTPTDWGVDSECFVELEETKSKTVRLRKRAEAGSTIEWQHDNSGEKLQLTFRRIGPHGQVGGMIGSAHRWVPSALRAPVPPEAEGHGDTLQASHHREVTLAPYVRSYLGSGVFSTRGYVGAWSNDSPAIEILDFALGRQYYNLRPPVDAAHRRSGTVIYLGPPQRGWGHFLTQGLSRLWYALEHPETPVLWDAPGLLPYQQRVLEVLGMRNEQHFLTEPVEWEHVIFPFPGLCIGEFASRQHTDIIGRVPPSPQIPGRRVFVSRSGLKEEISDDERSLDDLVTRHGFTVFRPEQHSIAEQLDVLSSAEVVLGLEGSALHTPLLLQDPIVTRFWALTRHRAGAGVFEHIRSAKQLRYETLNFLRSSTRGGHKSPFDLDLAALDDALRRTSGLTENLEELQGRIEHPWTGRTSYATHLRHAQVHSSADEEVIARAHLALLEHDEKTAIKLLRLGI
ncbi:glycosyltransferase 61 family protein [Agrococcus sp. Marseille-P2731]|uniref:glycosyltransferase 61 family protein n=1 Tax=Agrococcus sp. Marseille-P2731 TaxID=1841862 RepID=UPI0009308299|nr:glycosyltransferase 61 family protein [Agrococcus sp. Marseille-P2731]